MLKEWSRLALKLVPDRNQPLLRFSTLLLHGGGILGQYVKHKVIGESRHKGRLLRISSSSVATLDVLIVIDRPLAFAHVSEFLENNKCRRNVRIIQHVIQHGQGSQELARLTLTNLRACAGWTRSSLVLVVTRIGG